MRRHHGGGDFAEQRYPAPYHIRRLRAISHAACHWHKLGVVQLMAAPYAGPSSVDLVPDVDTMWRFISWWFEHCNVGLIEIGFMVPGTGQLTKFARFDVGDLSILKVLDEENRVPGQSAYIRASTILEDAPLGHTRDEHVAQAPGPWADLDTWEQVQRAQQVQGLIRANGVGITGRIPHLRYQLFTKASQPLLLPDAIRAINRRYQLLYGGDPAVANPSRLMRVFGSIAWPYKAGRVPELTGFELPTDDRPKSYPVHMIEARLPRLDEPRSRSPGQDRGPAEPISPSRDAGANPSTRISAVHALIDKVRAGRGGWHNDIIRLVAHWVAVGWSDWEILLACEPLTLPGWTVEQTRKEVEQAIDGARRKWAIPDPHPVINDDRDILGLPRHKLSEVSLDVQPEDFVEDMLVMGALSVIFGVSNSGKTFLAIEIAMHVAAGVAWRNLAVEQGAVLYLALEGGYALRKRLAAQLQERSWAERAMPFQYVTLSVNLRDPAADVNSLITTVHAMQAEYEARGILVRWIIVDTLARAMAGGNENSPEDMGALITNCDKLRLATGAHVTLIHHSGKDQARGARGHSSLIAAIDTEIEVVKGEDGTHTVTVTKQRDLEPLPRFAFALRQVQVGTNRRGKPITTCVIDEDAEPPVPHPQLKGHARNVFDCLVNLVAGPEAIRNAPGCPAGTYSVPEPMWRESYFNRFRPGDSKDAKRQAYNRSRDRLLTCKLVASFGGRVWLVRKSDEQRARDKPDIQGTE